MISDRVAPRLLWRASVARGMGLTQAASSLPSPSWRRLPPALCFLSFLFFLSFFDFFDFVDFLCLREGDDDDDESDSDSDAVPFSIASIGRLELACPELVNLSVLVVTRSPLLVSTSKRTR